MHPKKSTGIVPKLELENDIGDNDRVGVMKNAFRDNEKMRGVQKIFSNGGKYSLRFYGIHGWAIEIFDKKSKKFFIVEKS